LAKFFQSEELKEVIRNAVFDAVKDDAIGLKEVIDEEVKRATTALELKIQMLETRCDELRALINDSEQYSRKYNLRINGIDERADENCVQKVVDLCKAKLNIDVKSENVDRAHRLGPKRPGKARQIIVKFNKFHARNDIYRNRKLLKGSLIVLVGDFNGHFNVNDLPSCSDFGIRFHQMLECNNLFQLVDEPTRITKDTSSILDFNITDSPSYFLSTGTSSPPYNCDHNFIFAKMNFSLPKRHAFKRLIWNFHDVDSAKLNEDLIRTNWHDLALNDCDVK